MPTEWLEAGNLVGPASYVQERIAAFRGGRRHQPHITPVPTSSQPDPAATVAQVKEWLS